MSNGSSKYKCVIFDCDGVLVDSELIGNQVLVEMANALGAEIDLNYAFQHFKGQSLYKCMDRIGKLISGDLPRDFEQLYRKRSFARFTSEIKPVPNVHRVIENLKVPYCVASSGPVNKIELNLKLTGLFDHFKNRVFSCYEIQRWKPDPEIFLWAASTMGFTPEECIVIEDSVMGIQAALAGGFDVFAYTALDVNNELDSMATKSFDSMLKLPELL